MGPHCDILIVCATPCIWRNDDSDGRRRPAKVTGLVGRVDCDRLICRGVSNIMCIGFDP